MLKPLLMGAVVTLSLAAGLAGCASNATHADKALAANPDCVRGTGSRIKDPDQKCANVPGSSYTQEDLERTGQTNVGAALKQIDPRVR